MEKWFISISFTWWKNGEFNTVPTQYAQQRTPFGVQVSECQFKDIDGVPVIASLYLDKDNELFRIRYMESWF